MTVSPKVIGKYLQNLLKQGSYIEYSKLAIQFGMPPMTRHWKAHPLCKIFEILDHEDANANRPFRTSAVVSGKSQRPGQGFFDTMEKLRGITVVDKDRVWVSEFAQATIYPY